jgi:thioredoxin 1
MMAEGKEGLVIKVDDSSFKKTQDENKILLIDCYADWCGPCKMLAPLVEQLALEYKAKVKVGKLNTDDSPATAQQFGIMSIPTLLFFKEGKLADKIVGVVPKQEIEKRLNKLLV